MSDRVWEIRVVEREEDRLAAEPRTIEVGLYPTDIVIYSSEEHGRFASNVDLNVVTRVVSKLAKETPIDLQVHHHWDAEVNHQDWNPAFASWRRTIRARWPNIVRRVHERQLRRQATTFQRDRSMCLQICIDRLTTEASGRTTLQVFLVPKAHTVKAGINYETIAIHCAMKPPKWMCHTLLEYGAKEGDLDVHFKAGAQASHELVHTWGTWFQNVQQLIEQKRQRVAEKATGKRA